jgi:hypothetical protein
MAQALFFMEKEKFGEGFLFASWYNFIVCYETITFLSHFLKTIS